MSKKTLKTIRFSEKEVERVEDFIKSNPYLDFSTVIRMALNTFLNSPEIKLNIPDTKEKEEHHGSRKIQ